MPTRVALYTRVSTEDQAKEGFSLDAQLERLRYYAKAQGWEVAGEYVDEGHSGRTTKRPKYTQMMAERASWDTLLVLKMDRIHRNSRNFMAMMDELRKDRKEFASVMESLDTSTAMGRFVMDIIQRIAQLESEQIGERVYIGMEQKARTRGGSLGREAPFGYRYNADRVLEPVPEERPFIEELFQGYLAGAGLQELANGLASAGVKPRRDGVWRPLSVKRILTNPVYAGALRWDDEVQVGVHAAIVDPKTFDAVQDRINASSPGARTVRLTRLAAPPTPISR